VWAPVSGSGDTLVTLPSTLIAGGKSAVRNRSEPLRVTIRRSRSLTNFDACSLSMAFNLSKSQCGSCQHCARSAYAMATAATPARERSLSREQRRQPGADLAQPQRQPPGQPGQQGGGEPRLVLHHAIERGGAEHGELG